LTELDEKERPRSFPKIKRKYNI